MKASATSRLGETAAAIRKTLDGMWVNTIVFNSPKRRAIGAAAGEKGGPRVAGRRGGKPRMLERQEDSHVAAARVERAEERDHEQRAERREAGESSAAEDRRRGRGRKQPPLGNAIAERAKR